MVRQLIVLLAQKINVVCKPNKNSNICDKTTTIWKESQEELCTYYYPPKPVPYTSTYNPIRRRSIPAQPSCACTKNDWMNPVPYTPNRTRNIQMADPFSRVRKTDPVVTIGIASKSDTNRR